MIKNADNNKNNSISVRAGALKSSLNIELHSQYAMNLWEGRKERPATEVKPKKHMIFSMPSVIQRAGVIFFDSTADNPYADALLVALEQSLLQATEVILKLVVKVETLIQSVPPGITLSEVASINPLNIAIFSRSPLGYRCVWLLVGYDQLVIKTFQAYHYGLISRCYRDNSLEEAGHSVRKVYGIVQNYRFADVTRQDIADNTEAGIKAITLLGEPMPEIINGTLRSTFSPPLNSMKKAKPFRQKAEKT
ncbi:TIGR03761 family integrating conjugative element protein [Rouxiella badensis]|uniref:PFL_4669 family integrating conjugative element protein n=1 Tax=Rouxiella badensis TaxID=1646377 RepID=UPI001D135051|nr:TIGR03761 family integrating conjugative element protein [Rouxiella badensis]MCC3701649.1 TIGR03761 family integrating conjugative element protein [Rouxiella badensis]